MFISRAMVIDVQAESLVSPKGFEDYKFYIHETHGPGPKYTITELGSSAMVAMTDTCSAGKNLLDFTLRARGFEAFFQALKEYKKRVRTLEFSN